jgi:hypothetical protein
MISYKSPRVQSLKIEDFQWGLTQGTSPLDGGANGTCPQTSSIDCSNPSGCDDTFGGTQSIGWTCAGISNFQIFVFIPNGVCGVIPCQVTFNNQPATLDLTLTCPPSDPADCGVGFVVTQQYSVPSGESCDSSDVVQLINCTDGGCETCQAT